MMFPELHRKKENNILLIRFYLTVEVFTTGRSKYYYWEFPLVRLFGGKKENTVQNILKSLIEALNLVTRISNNIKPNYEKKKIYSTILNWLLGWIYAEWSSCKCLYTNKTT